MPSCVFRKCNNYTGTRAKTKEDVSFHLFPKDELLRRKWIQIARAQRREEDWMPTTSSTICSQHFIESDMYGTKKNYRKLIKTAIPVVEDEKSYRPLAQKCKEITAKEYLCSESSIAPYFAETCVEQLMKYRAHLPKCSKHKVITEELKTQKISDNVWIIFSKFKKVLTQQCSDDVIQEPLRGTYILTIQKPCDVTIGTLRLRANRFHELGNSYNRIPIVNLPDLSENKMENMEPINLQRVNLDEVQHLNYMLKKSVKSVQNSSEVKSLGIATIVLYIILLVFFVYTLQFKIIPYIRKIYETPSTPVIEHENVNENPILLHKEIWQEVSDADDGSLKNVPISDLESIFDTPRKAYLKKEIVKISQAKKKLQMKNYNLARQNKRLKQKCVDLNKILLKLKKDKHFTVDQFNELKLKDEAVELTNRLV